LSASLIRHRQYRQDVRVVKEQVHPSNLTPSTEALLVRSIIVSDRSAARSQALRRQAGQAALWSLGWLLVGGMSCFLALR
jgi:hypothetical protein